MTLPKKRMTLNYILQRLEANNKTEVPKTKEDPQGRRIVYKNLKFELTGVKPTILKTNIKIK